MRFYSSETIKTMHKLCFLVSRFCHTWLGLTLAAALMVLPAALALPQTVAAVCAPAVSVTSSLDNGSGGTLREAIAGVCPGGTITFDPSLSGATITITSTLSISQDVTIDGSGLAVDITINGNDKYRVFGIDSGLTAALKHLKIEHGFADGEDGGGIHSLAGSLDVTDSAFMNNKAGFKGGGIYSEGTLTISRTTFADNQSGEYGGGVEDSGGSLTITDSTFQTNSSNAGGALFNIDASLTVTRVTFLENHGSTFGGAIFHLKNADPLSMTVQDSTFDGNKAVYGGAAIKLNDGTGIVTGSTFIGNGSLDTSGGGVESSGTLTVANSTFTGNSGYYGGGIASYDTLYLWNSTFSGNSASDHTDAGGAAIYIEGVLYFGNNILANSTLGADCSNPARWGGQILTNSNNLVEDGTCNSLNGGSPANFLSGDPSLDALKDNGGPTRSMALLPGSTALAAGDYAICMAAPVDGMDQRGHGRSSAALTCDRGAYEYTPPAAFSKSVPGNSATGQGLSLTLAWTATSPATSYEYCYATTSGCTTWIDAGNATQVNIAGLDYSTPYFWQVRAWNDSDGPTYADSDNYWQFTTRGEHLYLYLPILMR
jgi:fibronectin-binding autotransporter adhesin